MGAPIVQFFFDSLSVLRARLARARFRPRLARRWVRARVDRARGSASGATADLLQRGHRSGDARARRTRVTRALEGCERSCGRFRFAISSTQRPARCCKTAASSTPSTRPIAATLGNASRGGCIPIRRSRSLRRGAPAFHAGRRAIARNARRSAHPRTYGYIHLRPGIRGAAAMKRRTAACTSFVPEHAIARLCRRRATCPHAKRTSRLSPHSARRNDRHSHVRRGGRCRARAHARTQTGAQTRGSANSFGATSTTSCSCTFRGSRPSRSSKPRPTSLAYRR